MTSLFARLVIVLWTVNYHPSLKSHVRTKMIILPPTLEPRTRQQLNAFVIASIEAAGVRVPPSSRLKRMHDLLVADEGMIEPSDPEFETALEAERDMQLLAFVFDQLAAAEPNDEYRRLVKKVVDDSVLPNHDRTQSVGRNAAFELFVGAICTSAQMLSVAWEEPDVTCVFDGIKYAFAAKRLKSVNSLLARVRKAVEQIDRSGLPGVIALDTCLAFNPNNVRISEPLPDAVFMSRYWKALRNLWSEHQAKVQKVIARADVLGLLVHDYQVRFQTNRQWALAGMTMRVPALARSTADQRRFDELATLYTYAMPNQEEVSEAKIILP